MFLLRHLLALSLLLPAGPILADTLAGRVSDISDGATLTVVAQNKARHKVHLFAIDAPESRQPYGKESKQHLSDLVLGKEVRVEWRKQDRYGRIVGKLILQTPPCATCPKTLDAGLAQLEAGLAWWDRESRREQSLSDQGYYEYAEFDAKTRRIGLWQDAAPVPPWEWRKKHQVVARLFPAPGFLARWQGNMPRVAGKNSWRSDPASQPAPDVPHFLEADGMRHRVFMPLDAIAVPNQKIPRPDSQFGRHHIVVTAMRRKNRHGPVGRRRFRFQQLRGWKVGR